MIHLYNRKREGLNRGPEPEQADDVNIYKKAMAHYQAGEYQQGAELFYQVIQNEKSNHRAWNAYGICFTKLGEYDLATDCFNNAISLDPGNETYQKNLTVNGKKQKRTG